MRGYAEKTALPAREQELFRRATALVESIPDIEGVRCHELARAVGRLLDLSWQDGYYGFVQHTWLWTRELRQDHIVARTGFPNILDVYSVGSLPMVRLVDADCVSLPHIGWSYRPGPDRTDIREAMVETLVGHMTSGASAKYADI